MRLLDITMIGVGAMIGAGIFVLTGIAAGVAGPALLERLKAHYAELDPLIQEAVAVLSLPMQSAEQNALMVNALQRASSIVVQNSLREGFGLTIAEGMWKRVPILEDVEALADARPRGHYLASAL
jgi:glycosyltransferase involved in cell wall biosynthesis